MNEVMPKRDQINFRVKPEIRADLDAIADYHGLTVSSYVHSVLVKQIRLEKEATPQAFENVAEPKTKLAPVVARIGKTLDDVKPTKDEVQQMLDREQADEIQRRLRSPKGVPLATSSKDKIPFAKTTQEKKRKTR